MTSSPPPLAEIKAFVWIPMMAALLALSAQFSIPLGPVPLSLQPFFVLLTGFLLGPRAGCAAMILYLVAGAFGLPVFANGKAGAMVLLGPTGGYLWAYAPAALVCGLAARSSSVWVWLLGGLCAIAILYTTGISQLSVVTGSDLLKAAMLGGAPFIGPDLIKCVAAVGVFKIVRHMGLGPSALHK